jgi:hypothetical protein
VKIVFFNRKLEKKELKTKIKEFAKLQQVSRVICSKKATNINGSYSPYTNTIFLCSSLEPKETLCTFFHELSHHFASKKKRWHNYHFNLKTFATNKIFLLENEIDKIAKRLWNKNVSLPEWGKYEYSYPVKDKRILLRWIEQHAKIKTATVTKNE